MNLACGHPLGLAFPNNKIIQRKISCWYITVQFLCRIRPPLLVIFEYVKHCPILLPVNLIRENPTPPSWFREVQRILISILLFSPFPPRNTKIHRNEESYTPTSLRHRENIGRIGSLSVFWQISVIAVFPLKTGDSMFVGFDSQNTSPLFSTLSQLESVGLWNSPDWVQRWLRELVVETTV